jgi:tripartite-type tricarboxylate transporter receptor subunit TctC
MQGAASAQNYPNRTIKVIFPLAAGGGGDVFTRALAEELQEALKQPVIVEDHPGGAQIIGARVCADAVPDGYTICVMPVDAIVYNQFLFKTLPFDPETAFEPVANLFFNIDALVVNKSLGVKSIAELVALSKAKPGTLSYGTFSAMHAGFMENLKKRTGADIVRVPFRGGSEVVYAVISGTTPVGFVGLSNMIPQLQSGDLVALAVNSKTRSPLFPKIPTMTEINSAGYDRPAWFGLFTPAGVPKPIVEKLAAEVSQIVARPEFRKRMYTDRAVEPSDLTLDAFADFIRQEREIDKPIIAASGQAPQ